MISIKSATAFIIFLRLLLVLAQVDVGVDVLGLDLGPCFDSASGIRLQVDGTGVNFLEDFVHEFKKRFIYILSAQS